MHRGGFREQKKKQKKVVVEEKSEDLYNYQDSLTGRQYCFTF